MHSILYLYHQGIVIRFKPTRMHKNILCTRDRETSTFQSLVSKQKLVFLNIAWPSYCLHPTELSEVCKCSLPDWWKWLQSFFYSLLCVLVRRSCLPALTGRAPEASSRPQAPGRLPAPLPERSFLRSHQIGPNTDMESSSFQSCIFVDWAACAAVTYFNYSVNESLKKNNWFLFPLFNFFLCALFLLGRNKNALMLLSFCKWPVLLFFFSSLWFCALKSNRITILRTRSHLHDRQSQRDNFGFNVSSWVLRLATSGIWHLGPSVVVPCFIVKIWLCSMYYFFSFWL
jgi:hypothetical protein